MRKHLYNIVDNRTYGTLGIMYAIIMTAAIGLALLPLIFREEFEVFQDFSLFASVVFIFDYVAKWFTADLRSKKRGIMQFLKYPFTFWAIVDLISILPLFNILRNLFLTFRIFRLFKIFRIFKPFERSTHIRIIIRVLRSEARTLGNVLALCIVYIIFSALIMFNLEESIDNFFDALYWATTALTTVGYGDIYPHSIAGKIVSMISSLFGIAIIALPAGIITARYVDELSKSRSRSNRHNE